MSAGVAGSAAANGASGLAEVADLLIVGAGAKAAAIAAKVHVVNELGLGPLRVTIVEKTEPAASWLGRNGMTSGEEPLAVPPIKDVGFPYRSHRQFGPAGEAIDAGLLPFSWQRHSIERHEYAAWVNQGAPPVRHRDYGRYLGWVLERATTGVTILGGRATEVGVDREGRWTVEVAEPREAAAVAGIGERGREGTPLRLRGEALLLTGPGVHRAFPHEPAAAERVLHCDSPRSEFARLPEDRECEVAIVGGGESALSALVYLRAFRPHARLTVYTPTLPMSRGESFLENRVFADPDDVSWAALDQQTRRDFVKHCDRGVFDVGVLASIADDAHCRFALGRVVHCGLAADGEAVSLEHEAPDGFVSERFDYVVNCTGFDLLEQLRGLFPEPLRAEVERQAGPLWDTPPGTEVPIGRALELRGMTPRLHIPGLGGLSQGPGFANLGSLGLVANRVLQPLLPELVPEGDSEAAGKTVNRVQRRTRGGSMAWRREMWGAAAVAAAVVVLALAGCGGSGGDASAETDPASSPAASGEGYPGTDLASTRFAQGSGIERATVAKLKPAWTLPLTAESSYGAYSATPVVAGGVVYSQDLESNVQAIDLESGEVLWTKEYKEPDQGPNGVVVGGGSVFGATPTKAFALNAETGEEEWSVDLADGNTEAIDMAPGYHEGLVYVSTVPTNVRSEYPSGGVGTLWALDAKSGKKAWHFDTAPKSLWGNKQVNSGGGLWYPPSFDEAGGMYLGTGNPAPYPGVEGHPWGSSRPGPDLYTDSLVKLDAKTGKLDWFHQVTPHDIYDWDFQDPPILAQAGGRELAVGAGKSGQVVAVDAKTGKPVWQTAVGQHNGHDRDGLLAMHGEGDKIKTGTVYPGTLGGVIAPMAANATTVFVPVVNHPLIIESGTAIGEGPQMSGELVALDLATGKLEWSAELGGPAYGAPTAVNDMVFVAGFDGTIRGFDAKTGGEVWQEALPAGSNTGLAISGGTMLVPAGLAFAEGQTPELVAFKLGG